MNRYIKFYSLIFILSINLVFCFSQTSKNDLFKKRKKILQEIELTEKLLKTTSSKKGKNISQVKLIGKKIEKRKEIITVYREEILKIDKSIKDRSESIKKLELDLEKQKKLYAEFIQYSYKNQNNYTSAVFLLASKDISQFYLRKKYLEQLREARVKKIELIQKLQQRINYEITELNKDKNEKESSLVKIESEQLKLAKEKRNRESTVTVLQSEESKLRNILAEKRRIEEEIENRITDLIKVESKNNTYASLTPEQKIISSDFARNKGRLPWPTRQGVITEKFGEHWHPVIKGVKVRNNGVDITTIDQEEVRSVFEGVVSKIFTIKGANYTVIIRHGTFYTVYHNLNNINVNVGDNINTKDIIGRASRSKEGSSSVVHFEIWKGLQKLNPEEWISN